MNPVHQLSLFMENSPGRLARVARALADAGVGIITMTVAEAAQYGVARLIADDWQRAARALEEAGLSARVTEVVAVRVPDRPGGLAGVLAVAEKAGVNVDYMYAFASRRGADAVLVFRFAQPREAAEALAAGGVALLEEGEL